MRRILSTRSKLPVTAPPTLVHRRLSPSLASALSAPIRVGVPPRGHDFSRWVAVTEKPTDGERVLYKIHDPATGTAAEMELLGNELIGAKGAYSKKSGSYLILVK
jgi:hypothetical protein